MTEILYEFFKFLVILYIAGFIFSLIKRLFQGRRKIP